MEFDPTNFSVGALLGIVVGAFVTHMLAKDRSRQDRAFARYNSVADALRNAFSEEVSALRGISRTKPGDTYEILKAAFPKHEKAIYQFRAVLSEKNHEAYDATWVRYYFPEGANIILPREEIPTYMLAQYIGLGHSEEEERRLLALERIENILVFARQR